MEGFGYRYLISDLPGVAGTVEYSSGRAVVSAYGLLANGIYDVCKKTEDGMFYLAKEQKTDLVGNLHCVLLQENRESLQGTICVATSDRGTIVLHEPGVNIQQAAYDIWQMKNNSSTKSLVIEKEKTPEVPEFNLVPEIGDVQALDKVEEERADTYSKHASDACVDMLPVLSWEGRSAEIAPYMQGYPVVSLPLELGAFWRFVRVPLAENYYANECLLGVHRQTDRIDAIAYLIEGKNSKTQHGIPGFRFQKMGNGSGAWIYMEEV